MSESDGGRVPNMAERNSIVADVQARHDAMMRGPHRWYGNTTTRDVYLATEWGGRHFILRFGRWGMQSAKPIFQNHERGVMEPFDKGEGVDLGFEVPYRRDFAGINHPDAIGLERAWEDREALLAEIGRLRGEVSDLRSTLCADGIDGTENAR